MFHNSQAVLALSKEPEPDTVFQKTLGVNDFYFRDPDFDYPMGNIQMVGKSQRRCIRGEKPLETKLAPSWALSRRRRARRRLLAVHRGPAAAGQPGHPRPPTATSTWRTRRATTPSAERLYDQLQLDARPARDAPRPPAPAERLHEDTTSRSPACAHQAGTCRFGTDPATSVLDIDCKAHELDNLYVVDTSFFPSIGAVNPALTAMANALRVGDHIRRAHRSHGRGAYRDGGAVTYLRVVSPALHIVFPEPWSPGGARRRSDAGAVPGLGRDR